MIKILFSKSQNEIFDKQIEDFTEDVKIWNITNFIIPSFIILIPVIFFSFLPDEKANYSNLILNGSFSLLGINTLFTMSIFLINSLRMKDQKMEKEIVVLRQKLVIYLAALLIFGTFTYVLQIMHTIDSCGKTVTISLIGFIIFYLSIGIGKRVFILKDELIGKPIEEDVIDNVKNLKNSLNDLD